MIGRTDIIRMKSASDLSEEQKQTVHRWADEGASLQEIQKLLGEEFGLNFTFMETRFLEGDLGLKIQSETKEEPEKEEDDPSEADQSDVPAADGEEGEFPPAGDEDQDEMPPLSEDDDPDGDDVPTVTVDQITKPGTIVSGRVIFAGGKGAAWALDQFGQLSLDPDDLDFRPSQGEVIAFQQELQRVARQQGL